MRNPTELGIQEGESATDAEIADVEHRIGRQLPAAYKELVRFTKAPEPEVAVVLFGDGDMTEVEFFPFSADPTETYSLAYYLSIVDMSGPVRQVPFARDAGDWLFCFEYLDGQNEPRIVLVPFDGSNPHELGENFSIFFDSIRTDL